MKTITTDNYHGICDAKGCVRPAKAAISLCGTESDLHLCDVCLETLRSGLNLYAKEKKQNVSR